MFASLSLPIVVESDVLLEAMPVRNGILQPFLLVAAGGLEKWWWVRGTPKGFRAHSAFLAIHRLDIQFPLFCRPVFTIQGLYFTIQLLHFFCYYCMTV
jgi:hypothetical protein